MKVILTQDVKKVGRKGEVKEVADGYAHNVLLPKKLALPGTPENLKKIEKEQEQKEDKKALDESLLIKSIKNVDGKTVSVSAKTNDAGGLFEAIHNKHIISAVKEQLGIDLAESVFVNQESIKTAGEHQVKLKVGKVTASLIVSI